MFPLRERKSRRFILSSKLLEIPKSKSKSPPIFADFFTDFRRFLPILVDFCRFSRITTNLGAWIEGQGEGSFRRNWKSVPTSPFPFLPWKIPRKFFHAHMQSRATRAEAFLSLLPLPFFPSRLLRDNFSYRGGWDFISLSPPLLFSGTRWNESWGDKGVNYYIDKKSISRALVIQFFFYFFFFRFPFFLLLFLFLLLFVDHTNRPAR